MDTKACTDESTRAAALVSIRDQFEEHEAMARRLRTQYNAFSFTCRFPREILGTVFLEVAFRQRGNEFRNRDLRPWYVGADGWIMSVSHVCSHWREVALTTPHLWVNIRVDKPKWAQEMLKRSKQVPLIIEHWADFDESKYRVLEEILGHELARIRFLKLTLKDSENTPIAPLLASLHEPAPLLEHLELSTSSPSGNAQLEGIIAPRLSKLTLHGYGLPTPSPTFANLRSLNISGVSGIPQPSILVLLDLISQTPLLELFHVVDVASLSISATTLKATTRPHIVLRHLEDISISCDINDAPLFFDTVIFSQTASSICFCFTQARRASESESTNSSILIISRLARKLDDHIKHPVIGLTMHNNGELSWWIDSHGDPIVVMDFMEVNNSGSLLMIAACRSLRLDQLSSLFVSVSLDVDEWLLFGDLPCLQLLYVQANERCFLEAFSRGIQEATPDVSIDPSFTALTKLEVVSWDFERVDGNGRNSVAKEAIDCLRFRTDAGLRLELLSAMQCIGFGEQLLHQLQEFITEVNYDYI